MAHAVQHGGSVDSRGFTLLEALVALAILTVAALATAQLLSAAAITVYDSRVQTLSTTLASQRMEQLIATDWSTASPGGSLDADVSGYTDHPRLDGRLFGRRWAIDLLPDGREDARVICVLVRSQAAEAARAHGARGEARLVTIRARLAR